MSSVILKEAAKHGVNVRIAHSHNSNQDKNFKYLVKMFYRRQIPKYATYLFACSQAAGDWMFCGAKFEVLNNAIDSEKYIYSKDKARSMRQHLGINENQLVVGHVGRFSYPKNHTFLVDVFKNISEKTDAVLLLVGDGKLRSEIENKVKMLGIEERVIFTGLRDDVPDLLQAMDLFVFPSNYEGLPVTLVEAQAAGLPCFISDKVPMECKKTDLVHQIKLTQRADQWAEDVMKYYPYERKNTHKEIVESGFDIKANAKNLVAFYVNELNKVDDR